MNDIRAAGVGYGFEFELRFSTTQIRLRNVTGAAEGGGDAARAEVERLTARLAEVERLDRASTLAPE